MSTFNSNIKVYVDPDPTPAVMPYKGSDGFDAGAFYCPNIPLQFVKLARIVDCGDMKLKSGRNIKVVMDHDYWVQWQGLTEGQSIYKSKAYDMVYDWLKEQRIDFMFDSMYETFYFKRQADMEGFLLRWNE